MKQKQILTIAGDGIGPELLHEAKKILKSLAIPLVSTEAFAGFGEYQKNGSSLPQKTIEMAKQVDAVLFGAVTTPPLLINYKSPIVALRKELDLFANIRPVKSLPIANTKQRIDMVIFRENTEDLYVGRERLIKDGAITERVITRTKSTRIIKKAFEFAQKHERSKVTLVHKANVMRLTDGLFLSIGQSIAKTYPSIIFEDMLVDAVAMKLVRTPEQFDVIVTTNMFGDILSDLCSAHVGGLGVAPSASIGSKYALFEPVHGSAPKYAGLNKANPTAMFLSTAMMLEYLGFIKQGKKLYKSVFSTIKSKQTTFDLGGKLSTTDFTNAVISQL